MDFILTASGLNSQGKTMNIIWKKLEILLIFTGAVIFSASAMAQGIVFRGSGAVNESMGGASAACPLSALGAMCWNPATMSAFYGTTVDIDLGLALPYTTISSQLPDALGGYGGGTSHSESGAAPLPNIAIVRREEGSPWVFGFAFGTTGGAKTNYSASTITENPILCDQALPNGMKVGYGNVNSTVQILQVSANVGYSFTDKLSFACGPSLLMADLNCDPLYVIEGQGSPNVAERGTGNRYSFGGGFQAGLYYDTLAGWRFGVSYKSQNWVEDVRFKTLNGGVQKLDLDYPAILSFGACWYGWEKWVLAFDMRYFFFESAGYDIMGWKDVFSFNFGIQRELSDRLSLRVGYSVNENQLDSSFSRGSLVVPLLPRHALFTGMSFKIDEHMTLNLTYGHIFKGTVTGCYMGKGYEQLGGYVTNTAEADEVVAGVSFNF